jgi:small subunit ribosomal protein S17
VVPPPREKRFSSGRQGSLAHGASHIVLVAGSAYTMSSTAQSPPARSFMLQLPQQSCPAAPLPLPSQETQSLEVGSMAGQRLVGLVSSAKKMQKTVMVEITRRVRHPKYNKEMRKTTRLMAHDEAGVLEFGDKVARPTCDDAFPLNPTLAGADRAMSPPVEEQALRGDGEGGQRGWDRDLHPASGAPPWAGYSPAPGGEITW